MTTLALPARTRVRFRRPKPPAPWKVLLALVLLLHAVAVLRDFVSVIAPAGPIDLITSAWYALFGLWIQRKAWPVVLDRDSERFPLDAVLRWSETAPGLAASAMCIACAIAQVVAELTPVA